MRFPLGTVILWGPRLDTQKQREGTGVSLYSISLSSEQETKGESKDWGGKRNQGEAGSFHSREEFWWRHSTERLSLEKVFLSISRRGKLLLGLTGTWKDAMKWSLPFPSQWAWNGVRSILKQRIYKVLLVCVGVGVGWSPAVLTVLTHAYLLALFHLFCFSKIIQQRWKLWASPVLANPWGNSFHFTNSHFLIYFDLKKIAILISFEIQGR